MNQWHSLYCTEAIVAGSATIDQKQQHFCGSNHFRIYYSWNFRIELAVAFFSYTALVFIDDKRA
jgi:hypothetical protein